MFTCCGFLCMILVYTALLQTHNRFHQTACGMCLNIYLCFQSDNICDSAHKRLCFVISNSHSYFYHVFIPSLYINIKFMGRVLCTFSTQNTDKYFVAQFDKIRNKKPSVKHRQITLYCRVTVYKIYFYFSLVLQHIQFFTYLMSMLIINMLKIQALNVESHCAAENIMVGLSVTQCNYITCTLANAPEIYQPRIQILERCIYYFMLNIYCACKER